MTEEINERRIDLADDEAAIVFTANGMLRLYKRVETHQHDHILAAALTLLTGEGERTKQAIDLICEEMQEQSQSLRATRELFSSIFKDAKPSDDTPTQ